MQTEAQSSEAASRGVAAKLHAAWVAPIEVASDALAELGYEAAHPALESPFWPEAGSQASSGSAL